MANGEELPDIDEVNASLSQEDLPDIDEVNKALEGEKKKPLPSLPTFGEAVMASYPKYDSALPSTLKTQGTKKAIQETFLKDPKYDKQNVREAYYNSLEKAGKYSSQEMSALRSAGEDIASNKKDFDILSKTVNAQPQNRQANYLLGSTLLRMGKPQDAISIYTNALNLKREEQGIPTQDERGIRKIIADSDDNILSGLGTAYAKMGETEQADDYYKKALEINPQNANALAGLAHTSYKMGRLDISRDAANASRQAKEAERQGEVAYQEQGYPLGESPEEKARNVQNQMPVKVLEDVIYGAIQYPANYLGRAAGEIKEGFEDFIDSQKLGPSLEDIDTGDFDPGAKAASGLIKMGFGALQLTNPEVAAFTVATDAAGNVLPEDFMAWTLAPVSKMVESYSPDASMTTKRYAQVGDLVSQILLAHTVKGGKGVYETVKAIPELKEISAKGEDYVASLADKFDNNKPLTKDELQDVVSIVNNTPADVKDAIVAQDAVSENQPKKLKDLAQKKLEYENILKNPDISPEGKAQTAEDLKKVDEDIAALAEKSANDQHLQAEDSAQLADLDARISTAESDLATAETDIQKEVFQKQIDNLKKQRDALQIESPGGVLQYSQEGVGKPRSERGRVEPSIKGEKTTPKGVIPKKEGDGGAQEKTSILAKPKEEYIAENIENLRNDPDADFLEEKIPLYKQYFGNKYDRVKAETTAVNIAPFYATEVSSVSEGKDLRSQPAYQQHVKNMHSVAKSLGIEIEHIDENVGGFENAEGKKIKEISNTVYLKTKDFEKAKEFAAVMGDIAPEAQESTIVSERVKFGENGHNAEKFTFEVNDLDKAVKALEESGIHNFTVNEGAKTIEILQISGYENAGIFEKFANFKKKLKEYGGETRRQTVESLRSEPMDARARGLVLENIRIREGRERPGSDFDKLVQEAIKRNERFAASQKLIPERNRYGELRRKQIELKEKGEDLSPEELSEMDGLIGKLTPDIKATVTSAEKAYSDAKTEIDTVARDIVGDDGFVAPVKIKTPERATQKTLDWYEAHPERLGDGARTNIVVEDISKVDAIFNKIKEIYGAGVLREEPNVTELGFPKKLLEVRTSNGRIAEFQVVTPETLLAKEGLKAFPESKRAEMAKVLEGIQKKAGEPIPAGMGHWLYEIYRDSGVAKDLREEAGKLSKVYYEAFTGEGKPSAVNFKEQLVTFHEKVKSSDNSKWAAKHGETILSDAIGYMEGKVTENIAKEPPVVEPPKKEEATVRPPGTKKLKLGERILASDEVSPEIKKGLQEKGIDYVPIKLDLTQKDAEAYVRAFDEAGEIEAALANVKDMQNGLTGVQRGAIGKELFERFADKAEKAETETQKKYWQDKAVDIAKFTANSFRAAGQEINAAKAWKRMLDRTPEGVIASIKKDYAEKNEIALKTHEKDIKGAKELIDEFLESKEFEEIVGRKVKAELEKIKTKAPKKENIFNSQKVRDARKAELREKWKAAKDSGISSTIIGLNKEQIEYLGEMAVIHLIEGAYKFASWAKKMKKDFEGISDEQLDYLWNKTKVSEQYDEKGRTISEFASEGVFAKLPQEQKDALLNRWNKRLTRMTPFGRKKLLGNAIDEINKLGGLSDERFREMYAEAMGLPTLTAKQEAHVRTLTETISKSDKTAKELQDLIDNDAPEALINRKKKEWQDDIFKGLQANKKLSDYFKEEKTIGNTLSTILQGNLLSPISIIKNIYSNTLVQPLRFASRGIASMGDYVMSKAANLPYINKLISEKRTIDALSYWRGEAKGVFPGLKTSFKELIHGLNPAEMTERDMSRQLQPLRSMVRFYEGLKGEEKTKVYQQINNFTEATLGLPAEAMFRLLNLGDKPFRKAAEMGTAYEMGKLKGLKGKELERFVLFPDEATQEQMRRTGEIATYQQSEGGSKAIQQAMKAFEKYISSVPVIGDIAQVIYKSQIPYLKTPLNIIGEVFEYALPEYTAARSIYHAVKGERREALNYMGKAVVGEMIRYGAKQLVLNNLVTPSADRQDIEGTQIQYQNIPPNSLNITGLQRMLSGGDPAIQDGDVWVNYNNTGVLGLLIGIHANRKDLSDEEQGFLADMTGSGMTLLTSAMEQSFLQGTSNMLNALLKGGRDREKWMINTAGALGAIVYPNTLSTLSKASDDYTREVKDMTFKDEFINSFKVKYFSGADLPSRVNLWGEKVKPVPAESNKYLWFLLDVTKAKSVPTGSFNYQIYDFWKKTEDEKEKRDILPNIPTRKVTVKSERIELDAREYEQYQIYVGKNRAQLVQKYIDSSNWTEDSREERIEKLKRIYEKGQQTALKMMTKEYPRLIEEARKLKKKGK